MGNNVFITKSRSFKKALQAVKNHFNTSLENINVEVINKPKKIFNFYLSPVIVRATVKSIAQTQEDVDACFAFEYRSEGVALVIRFEQGKGCKLREDDIIKLAVKKQIKDVDTDVIADAITKRFEEVIIAPPQEEVKVDEQLKITVSDNGMEAFVKFIPAEGGKALTYDDIVSVVEGSGIKFGVDFEKLKEIAADKEYEKPIKIASGKAPVNGKDGEIKYNILFTASNKPKQLQGGYVDYFERDNFTSVKAGDVLAVYIKPTPAEEGTDVLGNTIPAEAGKELNLPVGENVHLSEDGCQIIASVDGAAEIKKNKICVTNVLIINGNVDVSVGNINFEGNVRILGGVKARLSVTAKGKVDIFGTVESAVINAEGDVYLRSGILGSGKGTVNSGGNVYAKFIENANVTAKKNVYSSSIIHSNIECYDSIIVKDAKGVLYGGLVRAANKITAQSIGSHAHAVTTLEVGIMPDTRDEFNKLSSEAQRLQKELSYISNIIDMSGTALSKRQESIKAKLISERIKKKFMLEKITGEIEKLNEKVNDGTNSSVNVYRTIYPGTRITIETLVYAVNEELQYSTFKIHDGKIIVTSFEDK